LINPANKQPASVLFDVCEARGWYWVAAYGTGILQVDSQLIVRKTYATNEGLSNTGIYKIFPVGDSLLFVTSNNGLSVFNLNSQRFSNYYQGDGLHSSAFEEGCGAYKNGKIYVGGVNGFTTVNPAYYSVNLWPPLLYLTEITIETTSGVIDTSNISLSSLEIPNNALQTNLSFSMLNYKNPSRTTLAYKIKELKGGWIKLGTQHFINLVGIGPGTYTLLVKAANEDGVWSEKTLEIELIFLPRWYQTWYFKLLVALIIAGLIVAFFLYRVSQIKKRERLKIEIAQDLHDNIGSSLTAAKGFTNLARYEENKEAHLAHIEETIVEASNALRDLLWVWEDAFDTLDEWMERIKKFAVPYAMANKIRLECNIEEGLGDKVLSKPEKKNLLMIAKETINNSIKYSGCQNIKVNIKLVNGRLTFLLEDDGKGFDISAVAEGHGLKNTYRRAEEIHYTAEIKSVVGKGTWVSVVRKKAL
jgi:hypothetical protein